MGNARDLDQVIMGLERSDATLTISRIVADSPAEYVLSLNTHFIQRLLDSHELVLYSRISFDFERKTFGLFMELSTNIPFEQYGFSLDALNTVSARNPERAVRACIQIPEDEEDQEIALLASWVMPLSTIGTNPRRARPGASAILRRLLTQFCSESFELVDDFAAEMRESVEH